MADAAEKTGYSRAIDDMLSPNSVKVLQKRYLTQGRGRQPAREAVGHVRSGRREHRLGRARLRRRPTREVAERRHGLLRAHDLARVPAELAHADERRPRAPAALGVLRAAGRRLDGVDLRRRARHRAHPQVRRRHRLLVLAPAPGRRRRSAPPRASRRARSRSCACSTRRPRRSSRAAPAAAPTWASCASTTRTSSTSSSARPTATSPTSTSRSRSPRSSWRR